ncbi:MAG: Uma2 family endonuclease [Spirochaetaceae bacterium]
MPTKVSVSADVEHELLTADDFLDWLEPGRHADLIDGEVFMHSPVSTRHARLASFLERLLGQYIEDHDLGTLYREVVAVRLSGRNVFLPDLSFYTAGREDVDKGTYLLGAPDLVVEILSPRTGERDVGPKFAEYEQHGVREYWVLDPETLAHRFYHLEGEELVEFAHGEKAIASFVVPGFVLQRDWLDPNALPKVSEALNRLRR